MRLLDTSSLRAVEITDPNPNYAILSHTWEKEEVTFQQIHNPEIRQTEGFFKIRAACTLARSHGFPYIWIDTCCIDKRSSAELSEAINSMFKWYKKAQICYAYLSDLDVESSEVTSCRWFSRAWTLQELLAPACVLFYNRHWIEVGSKSSLRIQISNMTHIPVTVLLGYDDSYICVADRMRWASKREATRVEDLAYSLMGLFDINMPIIYGEGSKAFPRLQQEIIRSSNDHTIFAWALSEHQSLSGSLFAPTTEAFNLFSEMHGRLQVLRSSSHADLPFFMTNIGLRCELPFKAATHAETCAWALLNCILSSTKLTEGHRQLLMGLEQDHDGHYIRNGRFIVVPADAELQGSFETKALVIKHSVFQDDGHEHQKVRPDNVVIEIPGQSGDFDRELRTSIDWDKYGSREAASKCRGNQPRVEVHRYSDRSKDVRFDLIIGAGHASPWCDIVELTQDHASNEKPLLMSAMLLRKLKDGILNPLNLSDRAVKVLGGVYKIYASVRKGSKGLSSLHDKGSEIYVVNLVCKKLENMKEI